LDNKQVFEKALTKLNYNFKYDKDGDIRFEHEIGAISLEFENGYFALTHTKFLHASSYSQQIVLLNFFDEINAEFKAVKFNFIKSYAFVSVEGFYGNESNFEFVLSRSLKSMGNALNKFYVVAKSTLDAFENEK